MTDPPSRLPIRTASGPTLPARPPSGARSGRPLAHRLVAPSNRSAMDRRRRRRDGRRPGRPRRRSLASSGSSTVADAGPRWRLDETTIPRVERTTVPFRPATGPDPTTTDGSSTVEVHDHRGAHVTPVETVARRPAPPLDDEPSVVARPVPVEPPPPPPAAPPAPWADSVFTTSGGHVSTDVGMRPRSLGRGARRVLRRTCRARSSDGTTSTSTRSAAIGTCGCSRTRSSTTRTPRRRSGTRASPTTPRSSRRATASGCSTAGRPPGRRRSSSGPGTTTLNTWFWPMGGEVHDGRLYVFWAEMRKDFPDPKPPDGLGWHPVATHIAAYDTEHPRSARLPSGDQRRRLADLRLRGGERRHAHLPVRQHVRAEPLTGGRLVQRAAQRDEDVPGPCPTRAAPRRARVLDTNRVDDRSPECARVPATPLVGVPDAAALHGRAVDRLDRGERVLGRRVRTRCREQPVGAVDHHREPAARARGAPTGR